MVVQEQAPVAQIVCCSGWLRVWSAPVAAGSALLAGLCGG
jgi:hypothetical protein